MTGHTTSSIPKEQLDDFARHLKSSTRILALLGAGLSASSGLPTFRGAGGLWRTHEATDLATPEAFADDPGLVWQFYSYRRHMAFNVQPNLAHLALAELARRKPEFVTLSQNVDGLSQRAKHPANQLHLLHGSLVDVRCTNFYCKYHAQNLVDPIVPALAIPTDGSDPTSIQAQQQKARELDISDADVPLPQIPVEDLPRCPKCKSLVRPGVVWFGEYLPTKVIEAADNFIDSPSGIDLMLVIGTSAKVHPAAGYIDRARGMGARVAVINTERGDAFGLKDQDWFFHGDAAVIVPEILKGVIGETKPSNERL
ncbi:putative SIR2 family histone deacetylase [Myriangium duriaei CBS 260.36]|uniref:SIR2 family histone deacetylase n=1 Tax=Myriangium duriaei CBS 260.36 TaxID=1168546 RepID=A0A9P4IX94_9PEZI|nr:putative SIR2 family histone deacetylase [Myriangium duriaei CBS 260.36]